MQLRKRKKTGPAGVLNGPLGALTAVVLATALIILGLNTSWTAFDKVNLGDIETVGFNLLTEFSMVFELVSILLLIAILGAIIIARGGREQQ